MAQTLKRIKATNRRLTRGAGMNDKMVVAPDHELSYRRSHQVIRALTQEILELERTTSKNDTDARVSIGERLGEVAHKLAHGEWLPWLDEEVPYAPRTAQQYIALAEWAAANPSPYLKVAPLGPSKVYLLMRLAPPKLNALLAKTKVKLPSGKSTTLTLMTAQEVAELVGHQLGGGNPPAADPLAAYQRRVSWLLQATTNLRDLRGQVARDDVAELRDALLEAANRLTTAFKLR